MTTLRTSPSPHWPPWPGLLPRPSRAAAAALGGGGGHPSTGPGTPEAGFASLVPEGAARESLVALVSTSDRDSGANGQVRCALYGHEHFRLQPAYAGSYLGGPPRPWTASASPSTN